MSGEQAKFGAISWMDLTVADASRVRDFYRAVVGWEPVEVPMGEYSDFAMRAAGSDAPVAGICHARGPNTDLPRVWLPYITVADIDASMAAAVDNGGAVISGPRSLGEWGRFCVVRDPAGAAAALVEPPAAPPPPSTGA